MQQFHKIWEGHVPPVPSAMMSLEQRRLGGNASICCNFYRLYVFLQLTGLPFVEGTLKCMCPSLNVPTSPSTSTLSPKCRIPIPQKIIRRILNTAMNISNVL